MEKCGAAAGNDSANGRKSTKTAIAKPTTANNSNATDGQQTKTTANDDDLGAILFSKRDESKYIFK